MFNAVRIQECLSGLVGLRQVEDPMLKPYDSDLVQSDSGLLIQPVCEILDDEAIQLSLPQNEMYNYPLWVSGIIYSKDQIVKGNSTTFYISLIDNNNQPLGDTSAWAVKDFKSAFIRDRFKNADQKLLTDIFNLKKLAENSKTLLQEVKLFDKPANFQNKQVATGRFVGYEIEPLYNTGIAIEIPRIYLQLTQAQDLTVYLYHSSQPTPIKSEVLSYTNSGYVQGFDLGWIVSYDNTYDPGGQFYLGYYETSLVGQAIIKERDFSISPKCSTCSEYDYYSYQGWSKLAGIQSIIIPAANVTTPDEFEYSYAQAVTNSNHGLNFSLSARCDLSEFLCRNRQILAQAVQVGRAISLLQVIAQNYRENGVSKQAKHIARLELMGSEATTSLTKQYISLVQGLNFDFSGLNSICLPCEQKGIKTMTA